MLRVALFIAVLLTVAGSLVAWLGLRVVDPLGLPDWGRALGWGLLILPALGLPAVLVADRLRLVPGIHGLASPLYVLMGLFSFLLTLTLLRELGWVTVGWWIPSDARELWLRWSSVAVVGVATVLLVVGMVQALRPPRLVTVPVPLEGLHPDLVGTRIVLLTDVHLGGFTRLGFMDRLVDRVNALDPDLVAVTGDLGEGHADELGHLAAPLARVMAPAFFCAGNHEEIWGVRDWCEVVAGHGVAVLAESHAVVERDAATLLVAGVSDLTGRGATRRTSSDPGAARAGAPETDLSLLLAHQPGSALAAAEAGYDLQLSGHTHGGQFWPWTRVIHWVQPFAVGLHRHHGLTIYTSVGTRFWGPPVRLGTRPELTLLVLEAG